MPVFISDACIFILLIRHGILESFFHSCQDVKTSSLVWFEMRDEQQESLSLYIEQGNLSIVETEVNSSLKLPKSLSLADVSVISLANSLNGIILSSDKLLRLHAQKHSLEVHGFLWIIQRMIKSRSIDATNAKTILESMLTDPLVFRNKELLKEVENTIQEIEMF